MSSITNIRKQLHGNARTLPDSFNNHFLDFDDSGKDYMVVTMWRQAASGTRPLSSKFFTDGEDANAHFLKLLENKEIHEVYLFRWDLGIDLIKTGESHRADLLAEAFKKAQ